MKPVSSLYTVLSVSALLFGTACGETLSPLEADGISAAVVSNVKGPIAFSFFNSCTGEVIDVTAVGHFVSSVTNDGNGGFHIGGSINWQQGKAIGQTTGNEYEVILHEVFHLNVRPPFPVTEMQRTKAQAVSHGSDATYIEFFDLHFTVNANGTTTVSNIDSGFGICQ